MRFGTLAGQPLVPTGLEDLATTLKEGYQLGRMPEQTRLDEEKQRLANSLTSAQTETEKRYGGLGKLQGVPSQVASAEMLKNQYGENSPQYKQAIRGIEANIAHQEAMTERAPYQFMTNTGRKLEEEIGVRSRLKELEGDQGGQVQGGIQGFPDSNDALSAELQQVEDPEEREMLKDALDQYTRERRISATDPSARASDLKAQMIDPTLEKINPEEAFVYSGYQGMKQKVKDMYDSSQGNAPDRYIKYKENRQALSFLAKQYRNFLGDSTSKNVQSALDDLFRPESFWNSPDVAKAAYNTSIGILNAEMDILSKASKSERQTKEKDPLSMTREEIEEEIRLEIEKLQGGKK
jgi:hypothetical protein